MTYESERFQHWKLCIWLKIEKTLDFSCKGGKIELALNDGE